MSCHSTPANVAVLGFYAQTHRLPTTVVETEFHWLKKIGRDRAVMAPTEKEWEEFLLQRERWVKHETSITPGRREKTLARLSESYHQVPDGPTYYALNNLPVRLRQVSSPSSVLDAADKVDARLERIEGESQGKNTDAGILKMADIVNQAAGFLGLDTSKTDHISAGDEIRHLLQGIRQSDLDEVRPEQAYLAHQKLLEGLRVTRRSQKAG